MLYFLAIHTLFRTLVFLGGWLVNVTCLLGMTLCRKTSFDSWHISIYIYIVEEKKLLIDNWITQHHENRDLKCLIHLKKIHQHCTTEPYFFSMHTVVYGLVFSCIYVCQYSCMILSLRHSLCSLRYTCMLYADCKLLTLSQWVLLHCWYDILCTCYKKQACSTLKQPIEKGLPPQAIAH